MILQPSLILQLLGPPPRILRLGLNLAYFLHCPWDQSRTDEFLIASLSDLKQELELHNSPTSHVFLRFAELSKNSKNLNYISGAVTFLISTQHMKLTRHVLVSRTVGCRSILQSSRNTIVAETCRKYQSFSMYNDSTNLVTLPLVQYMLVVNSQDTGCPNAWVELRKEHN